MSHTIEDLQAKTDKLVKEAAGEDRTPGEHRKDGGCENNQSTYQQQQQQHPASNTINGRDLKDVTPFTCLGSTVSTTGGADEDVKSSENQEGEKHIHQPEINLKIFVTQHQQQNSFGFSIQTTSSQSVLLYGTDQKHGERVTKNICMNC
ncbi:unnamed protein product [Trichobilharzia regenti]|nr:unnamed protein product [Trichobilharzia regenti]